MKIMKFLKLNRYKHHFKNIFWSNTNQAILTIASLILSIVFARLGTKELYGQYLFIISLLNLFSIVSISGVKTVIFRYTSQNKEGVFEKGTKFSFLWSLWAVPLLLITGIYFYIFKSSILGFALLIAAVFFPFVISLQTWDYFLKGRSDFKKLALYNFIKLFVQVVTIIISIVLTKNLIIIMICYLTVNSFFNVVYFLNISRRIRNNKTDDKWKSQSYALNIMTFSSLIFGQLDMLLIGMLLPITQLAIYGLVMRSVDVVFQTIGSTVDVIRPKIYSDKKIKISYFYKFAILSILIPALAYPFVKYPVLLLYGNQYLDVVFYARIYLFAVPIYFMSSISQDFLIKHQLNKEINITKMIAIISVVLFYSILIPKFGLLGGVIGSAGYFLVQAISNLIMLRRYESRQKNWETNEDNVA